MERNKSLIPLVNIDFYIILLSWRDDCIPRAVVYLIITIFDYIRQKCKSVLSYHQE